MKSKFREYIPVLRDRHFHCPGYGKLGDADATHCHTLWPTPYGLCDVTVELLHELGVDIFWMRRDTVSGSSSTEFGRLAAPDTREPDRFKHTCVEP